MSIDNTDFTDILRVQGVHAKGYGIIPKIVMQDQRLTVQAKAIYAYFCSFAGTGDTAFPSAKRIMRDLGIKDIHTFSKHRNLLVIYGYLKFEQLVKNGVFSTNIYTLISNPEPKNVDNKQLLPGVKKSHSEVAECDFFRLGKNPTREKSHSNNNSIEKNNNIKKNNTHIPKEKKQDYVCENIHISPEQLQTIITSVIGVTITIDTIKMLIRKSSVERIYYHLQNWHIHKHNQKTEGAGYFITVIKNDIEPIEPEKKIYNQNRIQQRDNFEQREYSDDYLEGFYDNLKKD